MNDEPKKPEGGPNPYALVAMFSGGASVAIVCGAFLILHTISDAGMWAIAAMAAAPAVMGIGVARYMNQRSAPRL